MKDQAFQPNPVYSTVVHIPPQRDGTFVASLYKDGRLHGQLIVRSLARLLDQKT